MNKYTYLYFESISSTNTFLKENYKDLDEFSIAYTYNQTNGRGRLGRVWNGGSDNIAFSILLKPKKKDIAILSLLAGLAVSCAIDRYINTSIKWPNDIIINDKKVCGILAESIISDKIDAYIVGIGINVNQIDFPSDIKDKATSIKLSINKDINQKEVMENVIKYFDDLYNRYLNDDYSFIEEIRNKNYLKDKTGIINNKKCKVIDIDNEGNLIVEDKNKELIKVLSGEFSLQSFYKC